MKDLFSVAGLSAAEAETEERCKAFARYQVDARLLSSAGKDVIFMHPLPVYHGEEVAVGLPGSRC